MVDDAIAKAKAIAARLTAGAGAAGAAGDSGILGKRSRWGDAPDANPWAWGSGTGRGDKRKKIYIPVDEHPDVNFMGLLIGPRGSNQKRMQEESGARVLIRGQGSQKDDRPNPNPHPDDNDRLHVAIVGDTDEAVEKAAKMVEEILFNPEKAHEIKQNQLRQ